MTFLWTYEWLLSFVKNKLCRTLSSCIIVYALIIKPTFQLSIPDVIYWCTEVIHYINKVPAGKTSIFPSPVSLEDDSPQWLNQSGYMDPHHSDLKYCNTGLMLKSARKLHFVQSITTQLLLGPKRNMNITPILQSLHWLPISYQAIYKVPVTTYKALDDLRHSYLPGY